MHSVHDSIAGKSVRSLLQNIPLFAGLRKRNSITSPGSRF